MALSSSQVTALRNRALVLHNNLRKDRNGKTMLSADSKLQATAQDWAQAQANANTMKHSNTFGKAYPNKSAGENVAGGYSTADSVVLQGWRRSCAHYYNMVNGGFNKIGIGVAQAKNGKIYWATHFSGNNSYCQGKGCASNASYCCACNGSNSSGWSWKGGDQWRCPGGGHC